MTRDRAGLVGAAPGAPVDPLGVTRPILGTAPKRNRKQRESAAVITADARCTPVLVRAAIVGRARMPRAGLEISTAAGHIIGWVSLPNTSKGFDLQQRWWLVGDPTPGSIVALVSEGRTQVLLPGGRLHEGPVTEPVWSRLACRMLGWERPALHADAPAGFHAVYGSDDHSVDSPAFLKAVDRFRFAAVTVPFLFFLVCFPYLFVIPPLVHSGLAMWKLLAFPLVGGGLMLAWSAQCRRDVAREAEVVEAGAAQYGKQIAFTQSYWTGMRKESVPWDGPIPTAAV